jgi:acetyl esterase/lipase
MLALGLLPGVAPLASAAETPAWSVRDSVIYARVDNTALTYDVFTPANQNGAAVLWILSGGWVSSKLSGNPGLGAEYLKRGYTLFTISHGSTPRYTIDEIIPQVMRAVRHIRANAAGYGVAPDRFGVTGASAGGHLSLMIGLAGDAGDPAAKDPVDRVSSRVQAIAAFYPPTDFLNYGEPGARADGRGTLQDYRGAFAFRELSSTRRYFMPVEDPAKVHELARRISPVTHVSADDPPTLLVHGDQDKLVPLQQSQLVLEQLQRAGVATKLIVRPGEAHGWKDRAPDFAAFADWFDQHLGRR